MHGRHAKGGYSRRRAPWTTSECLTTHEIQRLLEHRTAEAVTEWLLVFAHAGAAGRKRMLGSL